MELPESEIVKLRRDALLPEEECLVVWRRSPRARRVSLRICPREGAVVVTLPPRAGRRAGMALLTQHAAWVVQRLAALDKAQPLADGSTVPIGGEPVPIRHAPDRRGAAFLEGGVLHVTGQAEFLPRRVTGFLKDEAARRISAALPRHCSAIGVRPKVVRVKDTRSRWGSCAPDGTLAFSWRLVMAPDWVLDYVVAHEVAHLRELNHSDRFWTLLDGMTPDRERAERWLKANGPALMRVG
ncbi:MAG: M48 family metallopeptidase [Acetobacteraceae bacterium]|nr:M48 family metallopeptidase [Acetobacteraceae bacterium]